MTSNPEKIAKANGTQIQQMFNSLARAERLSDYNNADAIEHGHVKWILLRLKELLEQEIRQFSAKHLYSFIFIASPNGFKKVNKLNVTKMSNR